MKQGFLKRVGVSSNVSHLTKAMQLTALAYNMTPEDEDNSPSFHQSFYRRRVFARRKAWIFGRKTVKPLRILILDDPGVDRVHMRFDTH
jgi:hypothetical protein